MPGALFLLLSIPMLLAGEPAYYHPDDVASRSSLFARAAREESTRFDLVQRKLELAGSHLDELDRNAALAGMIADPAFLDYAGQTRKEITGAFLRLQAFVDVMTDDFSTTFGSALERALPQATAGYDVVVCKESGFTSLMDREPCPGEDLNRLLAQALDQDQDLAAQVDEILSVPWPELDLKSSPLQPIAITGTEQTVRMSSLAEILLGDSMDVLFNSYQQGIAALEEDLDSQDPARKQQALEQGETFRAAYEEGMAALGRQLLQELRYHAPRLEKKDLPTHLAICPNPPGMGGCTGNDVTATAIPILQADRKLRRSLK